MERLEKYFKDAETCESETRTVGTETESLFVNELSNRPISLKTSQKIMENLVTEFGYKIKEEKNNLITRVEDREGFTVFYELGWNNFELTTPPANVKNSSDLFLDHDKRVDELSFAGKLAKAKMLNGSWDNSLSNTLIIPDKRDEVWLKLDGPALYGLGHIASIHLNISLTSINEGMEWLRKIKYELYATGSRLLQPNNIFSNEPLNPDIARNAKEEYASTWPPKENYSVWQKYINESFANYENGRYGPPPDNFQDYCKKLSEYKVVMNRINGELNIFTPAMSFAETKNADIDLFLRSVWWWSRLRVRGENLVLEIRDIPRALGPQKAFLHIMDAVHSPDNYSDALH